MLQIQNVASCLVQQGFVLYVTETFVNCGHYVVYQSWMEAVLR